MGLLNVFIDFLNMVLSFEILGIPLYDYLFAFTLIEFIIYIVNSLKH